ncbi:addiction module antidote protein [Pigmentiphaga litoralis]|uniref:addiction module antidote protein n=1 Tax=Pigmentiphaga litoralis TaxID=516702 RepID=UPI003899F93B
MGDVTEFDVATCLDTVEARSFFMADAFESGDASHIAHALGICARAADITTLAEETGLSHAQLYSSLSKDGNPTLHTVLAVVKHLGISLSAHATTKECAAVAAIEHDADKSPDDRSTTWTLAKQFQDRT